MCKEIIGGIVVVGGVWYGGWYFEFVGVGYSGGGWVVGIGGCGWCWFVVGFWWRIWFVVGVVGVFCMMVVMMVVF